MFVNHALAEAIGAEADDEYTVYRMCGALTEKYPQFNVQSQVASMSREWRPNFPARVLMSSSPGFLPPQPYSVAARKQGLKAFFMRLAIALGLSDNYAAGYYQAAVRPAPAVEELHVEHFTVLHDTPYNPRRFLVAYSKIQDMLYIRELEAL